MVLISKAKYVFPFFRPIPKVLEVRDLKWLRQNLATGTHSRTACSNLYNCNPKSEVQSTVSISREVLTWYKFCYHCQVFKTYPNLLQNYSAIQYNFLNWPQGDAYSQISGGSKWKPTALQSFDQFALNSEYDLKITKWDFSPKPLLQQVNFFWICIDTKGPISAPN